MAFPGGFFFPLEYCIFHQLGLKTINGNNLYYSISVDYFWADHDTETD